MILAFWVSIAINVVFLILVICAWKDDGSIPEEWKNEVCRMIAAGTSEEQERYHMVLRKAMGEKESSLCEIKKEIGYGNVLPEWSYKYLYKPTISVAEKIDALYEYLKLEAKKGELVVVSKKKGK
jgi:hypothetical protein